MNHISIIKMQISVYSSCDVDGFANVFGDICYRFFLCCCRSRVFCKFLKAFILPVVPASLLERVLHLSPTRR